ncbi:MAG: hypothetical protein A2W80_16740 [Candidatus Riflebacteria bacterium GWC2_50_8]|nr:MAG: hypothetical protein A2W80_16740 [Candidatus Riflebacteria bacterium GWC2_50_8]
MKKLIVLSLMVLLSAVSVFAQDDLDPAYAKNFGGGIVLISQTGCPPRAKFDMSMFDYRDGKFFLPAGDQAQLNVRALLPQGVTLGSALEKVKKDEAANLQHHKEDLCFYKVWSSYDSGSPIENIKWPANLKELPKWASSTDGYSSLSPDIYGWVSAGMSYEGDFRSSFWSIMGSSVPGQKLYVTFHVGFEYQVPGGQVESKWNDVLQKFENVTSTGMIGYACSEPLAAATVEFK